MNGVIADGCETDLNTSAANCGQVGNAIPAPGALHANWACVGGMTTMTGCIARFFDADGSPVDGCEFAADPFEPDDSQAAARFIGGLGAGLSLSIVANLTPGNDDWCSFDTSCSLFSPCQVVVTVNGVPGGSIAVVRDDGALVALGQPDITFTGHRYTNHVSAGGGYPTYSLTIRA